MFGWLVYKVSSRIARAAQRNPASKNKSKQANKKTPHAVQPKVVVFATPALFIEKHWKSFLCPNRKFHILAIVHL